VTNSIRAAVLAIGIAAPVLATEGAAQEATRASGRVEGVATISTQLAKSRRRMRIYTEPGQQAAAPAAPTHPLSNVVIYLEPVGTRGSQPGTLTTDSMRQHGATFIPYVLPILAGSSVEFPNEDPFYHNVFSLSRAREFDLGRYPRGESKRVRFDEPGVVQVFCHIHADMSAYILVLATPHFIVPDAQGRFVLDGVAPGDYRLIAWHERIRPVIVPIRIEAGRATPVQLRIPLPDAPPR
jgi:plastocyanin